MRTSTLAVKAIGLTLTAVLTAACDASAAHEPAGSSGSSEATDQRIHDLLPQQIQDSGELTVVISGIRPPIWMTAPGHQDEYVGAGADLMAAAADVMGVHLSYVDLPDISGAFAAISTGRYDLGFPMADLAGGPEARPGAEFVDVIQEVVPFLVRADNPQGISSLDTLCGATVAASTNAATYRTLQEQAKSCPSGEELTVLGVGSIPDGVLAVRSGRADAFFTGGASLFYAAQQSPGEFEVVGEDAGNGFEGSFMGALLPDGSALGKPLLAAFWQLFDDGTYARIMKKWGLEAEMIDEPGVNLYSQWLADQQK